MASLVLDTTAATTDSRENHAATTKLQGRYGQRPARLAGAPRAVERVETTKVYTDGSRKVSNATGKFSLWFFDLSSSPNCKFPLQEELRLRSPDILQLSWVSSCWYHCSSMKDRISGVPTMTLSYSHKNNNLSRTASCSVLLPQGMWRKGLDAIFFAGLLNWKEWKEWDKTPKSEKYGFSNWVFQTGSILYVLWILSHTRSS